jgi:hypothetical protein
MAIITGKDIIAAKIAVIRVQMGMRISEAFPELRFKLALIPPPTSSCEM